jgi:hypothetical protein
MGNKSFKIQFFMNIRKSVLAIASCIVFAGLTQAQTADDVINKSVEATGGKAKWEALKTITMKGKQNMQGMEFPAAMYQMKPNSMKIEATFQGKTFLQVADGKNNVAWSINPFMGTGEPEKASPEVAKEMFEEADFEPKYVNYATKGHKAVLEGKEDIEGAECFKLKLTTKSGEIEYHYFDTETYARIMQKSTILEGENKGEWSETYYSDYKEVQGLMFPHAIASKIKGETYMNLNIESIKLNETMNDDFFAFPKK